MSAQPPIIDAVELESVKSALNADITDAGVGILHLPTNRVHLRPSSQTTPVGHDALVKQLQLDRADCRGFVIVRNRTMQFVVENISGLNGPQLRMPQELFDGVVHSLNVAGL